MRRVVHSVLREIRSHESTNLCGGLELGLEKASQKKEGTNLVLLLSDGLANVGVTDIDSIAERSRIGRRKGIVISTIGVGNDYNEALMVALADQRGGRFCHVEKARELTRFLTEELGDVANAAARETQIHLSLPAGAVLSALASAYPIQHNGQSAVIGVGDIPCDTELEVPLAIAFPAQSSGVKLSFEGAVEYHSPAGNHLKSTLNRVTLRVVSPSAFHLRDGVAVPVAERVLDHLKASSVLKVSYTLYQSAPEAPQQQRLQTDKVRRYATLLGEERAEEEYDKMETDLNSLSASPIFRKQAVAAAHYRQRNPKRSGPRNP
jgi:Ca-activated chloride channel family protein